jgi:hypothetical protein
MTKELGDVLGAAEAATERGLPAFDHVVMAKDVTRKAKRRRTMREARTGFLATAAVGALGLGGFLAYDHFKDVTPVVPPDVSSTTGPSPSPTTSGDWPDVADRAVTTGDGLPDAVALTGEAYATADTGWVLSIFDSTQRGGVDEPIEGERVLSLISTVGERFEVANLTPYGSPHLAAWDTERQVALIVEGGYVALTVDLASGEVIGEWQFCGQRSPMSATDLPGDQWLLRGDCEGNGIGGIYADDFSLVTEEGVEKGGGGVTVTDIGDIQVKSDSELPAAEIFVAVHPDGTEVAMQSVGDASDCYPRGPSLMGGLAVTCYGTSEMRDTGWDLWADRGVIWNLDLDGGAPTEIAGLDTYTAIENLMGEALSDEGISLNAYYLAGDHEVVAHGGVVVAVLDENGPVLMTNGEYGATTCYGGVGGTVLVAGDGPLWTWDATTGATVTLLPVPEFSEIGFWVGASEGGAIIHP